MGIFKCINCSRQLSIKAGRLLVQRRNYTQAAKIQRIFSGIQPTGEVHIGNYLGAMENWVKLQSECSEEVLFSIVDLHSITVPQNPKVFQESTRLMACSMLACGIDPSKSIIFKQSEVSQHAELAWILSCITPVGILNRMHQWKSKSDRDTVCLGLYSYPVLMAADILLYRASHVPIGDDQLQHLELARELARIFNNNHGNYFTPPKPLLAEVTRVMSLRDPTKKMSKSEPNPLSRIGLTDPPDLIASKIRKSVTDSSNHISYNSQERPGISNLIDIYCAFSGKTIEEVCSQYQNIERFKAQFKHDLIDMLIEKLNPIREDVERLQNERTYVDGILKDGAERAKDIAERTLSEVKALVGFI